jgi:hypothetical protein
MMIRAKLKKLRTIDTSCFVVGRLGRRGMRIGCWWESQREGGHYEDKDVGS